MCCPISPSPTVQTRSAPDRAKSLGPEQRQDLAVQALAGTVPITTLADRAQVSRKFVYQQQARARDALADAFGPPPADDPVLFQLPVTKAWVQQFALGLVLIGHCPLRGVVEICRDLLDHEISLGTVHNLIARVVTRARQVNQRMGLGPVQIGAHDEIFQHGRPVLVGVDTRSTDCYLLRHEAHRDADTWGVRLLELHDRGFHPDAVVADAGKGLRAGLTAAFPGVPCRSDVFHALREVRTVVTLLENRAYRAMEACERLRRRVARLARPGRPLDPALTGQFAQAVRDETQAIAWADQVALLAEWIRHDILGLDGPPHPDRLALFDFILAELDARRAAAPTHLGQLVGYLRGQRDDLLRFAAELDTAFAGLAEPYDLDPAVVRELFAVTALSVESARRWPRDAALRDRLGRDYVPLARAVEALRRKTVRASSLAENLNSRLRGYFFLRRHLGNDYLALLQFFLNHRRFPRSDHPERVEKSPAEVLTGKSHPHWLELLGFTRFSRT